MEDQRMTLLDEKDWNSLPKTLDNIKLQYRIAKFISVFSDDYEDIYNTQNTKQRIIIPVETRLKVQALYHKVKALRKSFKFEPEFYGLTLLFMVSKVDEVLIPSENLIKLYLAMLKIGNNPFDIKYLFRIAQLPALERNKRKENILKEFNSIPSKSVQDEKKNLFSVEIELLEILGFDLNIETSLWYIEGFLEEYRKVIDKQQEQLDQNGGSDEINNQSLNLFKERLDNLDSLKTDIYRFNLCLYYTPVQLALATIKFAFSKPYPLKFPSYGSQPWWKFFNNEKYQANIQNEQEFMEPSKQFLDYIEKMKK